MTKNAEWNRMFSEFLSEIKHWKEVKKESKTCTKFNLLPSNLSYFEYQKKWIKVV